MKFNVEIKKSFPFVDIKFAFFFIVSICKLIKPALVCPSTLMFFIGAK